jgi:hypothetical protein
VIRTLIAAVLSLLVSAPAWADHGGGLRDPGMNPVVAALLWAGAAFLVRRIDALTLPESHGILADGRSRISTAWS